MFTKLLLLMTENKNVKVHDRTFGRVLGKGKMIQVRPTLVESTA
jgi:hypothetical protein